MRARVTSCCNKVDNNIVEIENNGDEFETNCVLQEFDTIAAIAFQQFYLENRKYY